MYSHFASKEEIFFVLLTENLSSVVRGIKSIIENEAHRCECGVLHDIYIYHMEKLSQKDLDILFIARNTIFPPDEFKEEVIKTIYELTSEMSKNIEQLYNSCIKKGIIKNWPVEEYVKDFYKLVFGYMYQSLALNLENSPQELDNAWERYWDSIRKQK